MSARGWQWARSEDRRTWTDIRGAASRRRSPEPADEGMYLRASVTYSDKFGAGKTASAVTSYRVEARTLANAAPSFAGADDDDSTSYVEVGRTVAENSAVGSPVGQAVPAIDADSDILFYELLDTPDQEDNRGEARFTIDSLSGRIRIGKVLGADAGEPEDEDSTLLSGLPQLPSDEDAGDPGNGEYVLRVKVSDPSTASATVNVIVRVTDVNEAPEFAEDAPTLLRVRENVDPPAITFGNGDSPVAADTFAATDQDAGDAPVAYSVTGDDREFFSFDGDILRFIAGHEPDFEEKDSYSITIMARSGEGTRRLSAALDVTVEVVDTENLGEVILSQREPQEGTEVHAVASDPDGGVRVRRWVWERSARITVGGDGTPSAECRDDPDTSLAVVGGWGPVEGAASFAYTPVGADVGRCLRATATYTDNIGDADQQATGVTEAPVQASRSANAAPQFVDPSGRTSRRAAENTEAGRSIGSPVTAFDDDGDLLIYTLGGEDAARFGV
ncbi:MAG: cadherin repeat domain-containing protein, partial [Chloroflexi bacterium]|nr:cadherin repeat domain-containing protein [Chloroflexota bacterium]